MNRTRADDLPVMTKFLGEFMTHSAGTSSSLLRNDGILPLTAAVSSFKDKVPLYVLTVISSLAECYGDVSYLTSIVTE